MQFRRPCASISSTAVVAVALMAAAAAPASARVAIGAPQAGSTSTGTIPFALKTARGVERAVFRIDGRRVDVDGSRPFRYGARGRLDTRRLRDGRHRLTVSVRMRSGRHVRLRRTIRVVNARAVVAADRLAPSLSWSSPRSGQTVRGLLEGAGCSVDARDKGGVARVEFLLDAVPMGHDTDAPYTCMWDTTASADGVRRVTAIAYDRAGNRTTRSIDVTVANGAAQQPTPTPTAEPTPISTPTPTLEPTASPTVTPTPTPTPVPRPVSGVFVSTQGSDATGTGALDRPYRTLGKAAAVAAAGQTVYVRGGTYVGRTTITRTATADAPIAFEPYPGESVVLDGTGVSMTYHESLVTINRSAFVTFEGFEIRNTQGRGLSVLDSTNVTIRGNAVHDTWSHPVMGSGDHLVFEGNRIHRGILANRGGTASNWPGGLSTWAKSDGTRSTDIAFRDNQITETWGEGIIALHADGVTVTGNTVRDVWSVMLYVDNASSVRVERNFLARSSATFDRSGRPAQGIMLANEYYAGLPARPIEDALIDNNVVIGAEHAIAYWHDTRRTTGNTYRGIRVFNNVFKDTRTSTIWLQDVPSTQTQPSGNLARNNIVFRGSDGTTLDIGDLAGWSFSNNAFPDGVPAGSHPASFSGDVQLVDPVAEAGPDGFRLRSTSPAIGAGTSVTEVGADFWGKPRGTRPSVGIHEG